MRACERRRGEVQKNRVEGTLYFPVAYHHLESKNSETYCVERGPNDSARRDPCT